MVFLDTNIYLHYTDFDGIDWPRIVDADSVLVIVPPITVRELNKYKDSPGSPRVRKRAAVAIRKLDALFDTLLQASFRPNSEIRLEDRDPGVEVYEQYELNRDIQDDQLIASILIHRSEHPNDYLVLITADGGLTLKAKANRHNIRPLKLDDRFKLSEELDSEQKRIRELEDELRRVQDVFPKLSLVFEQNTQLVQFVIPSSSSSINSDIDLSIEDLKKQFPKNRQAYMPWKNISSECCWSFRIQ